MRSVVTCLLCLVAIPAVAQKTTLAGVSEAAKRLPAAPREGDCRRARRVVVLLLHDFGFDEVATWRKTPGYSVYRSLPSPLELAEKLSTACELWILSDLRVFSPAHTAAIRSFAGSGGRVGWLNTDGKAPGDWWWSTGDRLETLPLAPPQEDGPHSMRLDDMIDALTRNRSELQACARREGELQAAGVSALLWTIDPAGRVTKAALTSRGRISAAFADCQKELSSAIQLPARELPTLTVVLPIKYGPSPQGP